MGKRHLQQLWPHGSDECRIQLACISHFQRDTLEGDMSDGRLLRHWSMAATTQGGEQENA